MSPRFLSFITRLLSVALLLALPAISANAAMLLSKISTADPVNDTAEAVIDGERMTFALTSKKILAINQLGEVVTEFEGMVIGKKIVVVGKQIYVLGSSTNTVLLSVRKFCWSGGKIKYVGEVNNDAGHATNHIELMVYGPEVWVFESHDNGGGTRWEVRQYVRGGDEEVLKKRSVNRAPVAGSTRLDQLLGAQGISNVREFRMIEDPRGGGFYLAIPAINQGTQLYRISVADDKLTKDVSIKLQDFAADVLDLVAANGAVYLLMKDNANMVVHRVEPGLAADKHKKAKIKGKEAGSVMHGGLAFTDNALFVTTAFTGGITLANREDTANLSEISPVASQGLLVGRLKPDLSAWTHAINLPSDGGASPVFNNPGARPFIMPGNSSILLVASVFDGKATFETGRDLEKASFATPLSSATLDALQRTRELRVRAEIKASGNGGGTVALSLPPGDVSPALGTVSQAEDASVTIKMPEHAYQFADGAFMELAGLSPDDISNRIKQEDVVARYTPVGYTVTRDQDPQTVTGDGASVTVVMTRSTTVTFHFKRDYALHIASVLLDAPGADSSQIQAFGNPNPAAQKHWIEENAVVSPQVDAVVSSTVETGTRFVTTGYNSSGPNGLLARTWSADNPRQQVPQFAMTGKVSVTYNWVEQHSITVSTSTAKSAGLPAIQIGGQVYSGSGVFWFKTNQAWKIGAADDATLGQSMWSVLNASGILQELNGYTKEQFPSADSFDHGGRTYAAKYYSSLTGPSTITWDYGGTIYRQVVSIGSSVQYSDAGSFSFPVADRLTTAIAARIDLTKTPVVTGVIEAPYGSDAATMMVWSPAERKAYPVRPGRFLIQWSVTDGGPPVLTEITSGFPGDKVRHPSVKPSNKRIVATEVAGIIPLKNTFAGSTTPNTIATASDLGFPAGNALDNEMTRFMVKEGANSGLVLVAREPFVLKDFSMLAGPDPIGRDATTVTIEGSSVSSNGPWTHLITSHHTMRVDSSFYDGSRLGWSIPTPLNNTAYNYYRILFPKVRGPEKELQFAELILIGLPVPTFPGGGRNYRCVLHEGMPPVDLDRSPTDEFAFKQLAFSAALAPNGGTDVAAAELKAPGVPPLVTDGKFLSFPVNERSVPQAEGKHVLVLTKAPAGTSANGDETREGLVVQVLETRRWNAEKEWARTTKGPIRKFQAYRFVPLATHVKSSGPLVLKEFKLLENGQERRPTAVVASNNSRSYPQTLGDPGRVLDAGGANLTYSDSTRSSALTFNFDQPMSIDSIRFQAGSEPGEINGMPVRFIVYGSINMFSDNWTRLMSQEDSDYPVASLDSTGTTPAIPFDTSLYEMTEGPMLAIGGNVPIGSWVTDMVYDKAQIRTGFVTGTKARYNVNVYDRSRVADAGPIIPVNRQFTGKAEDDLTVIWYESVDNILWPWRPVRYTPKWPATKDRIVIASRLGSEGVDGDKNPQSVFDKNLFSDVRIYNQPDPALPGFNPNEEHALVSGSLKFAGAQNSPLAAYALRNDLNVAALPANTDTDSANDVAHANYTSDPYVLVQYQDINAGEPRMKVYSVEKEDASLGLLDASAAAALDPLSIKLKAAAFSNSQATHLISVQSPALCEGEAVQLRFSGTLGGVTSGRTYYIKKRAANIYALAETPGGLALGQDTRVSLTSEVQLTRLHPYVFHYPATAGLLIPAPNPLDIVVGPSVLPETYGGSMTSYTDPLNPPPRVYYEDHSGASWVVSQGDCFTRFFYRMRNDFWFKRTTNGVIAGATDEGAQLTTGTSIAFVPEDAAKTVPQQVRFTARWPQNTPVLKVGESLTFSGGEYKQDHPDVDGLPGVIGWAAGRVVFDSLNPAMDADPAGGLTDFELARARSRTFTNYSAVLISPLQTRSVTLNSAGLTDAEIAVFKQKIAPATGITKADGSIWEFTNLPAALRQRIFFDPVVNQLGMRGFVNDKTLGDPSLTASPPPAYILEPNILSPRDRTTLLEFKANAAEDADLRAITGDSSWQKVVDALYTVSRNPAGLRSPAGGSTDTASYYAGMDWAPQRDARGNVLRFGSNGSMPAAADSNKIPATARRQEGKPVPTLDRASPPSLLGPGLALVPSPHLLDPEPADPAMKAILERDFKDGDSALYVTVAENDDAAIGGPVSMHIIKIVKKHRYRGALKLVEGDNAFSEKVTLRHTGDFGGNVDDVVYEWYYRPDDGRTAPWPYKTGTTMLPWQPFPDDSGSTIAGMDMNQINVAGKGKFILPDLWFITRYRHRNDVPTNISWNNTKHVEFGKPDAGTTKGELWAGAANSPQPNGDYLPQLVPGWLKRVLDRINPYEARFTDFRQDAPATYISMIQQAGPGYTGPVALNPDKNVVENVGLIELYQTLLERGSKFAFAEEIADDALRIGVMNALQLASTRIQDLYMVLGNEAYADAQDPLVGFGSNSAQYGSAASSIWSFMNQTVDPLEEELALLRGGSFDFGRPVHNRLFWNFTKDLGEVAYAQNYNLSDENGDGFINEADAMRRYPQGHGDAWGHYTTALKMHYNLLKNYSFEWQPRAEYYNLMDVVVPVDFYDERKFAFAAASRAKAGADIVSLTYRQRYTEDPDGQWQGYKDTYTDRAWGVQEWAHRAGEAALLDWATANAMLPAKAANGAGAIPVRAAVTTSGGQTYRLSLTPSSPLPRIDAAKNVIRYLLTITPPNQAAQEVIFQVAGGPWESTTVAMGAVTAVSTTFDVRFKGAAIPGLTEANFQLTPYTPVEGIQKVDRTTTTSINQIAAEFARIETTLRNADTGLNPLGLANGAVPFDIDPNAFAGRDGRQVVSHFQQIYDRARKAVQNAHSIFNGATEQLNQVRRQQDSLDAFSDDVAKGDRELRNRLIEIFGKPHAGNIGAGKPYPAGYNGPDLFFYMYVDVKDVNADTVPYAPADNDAYKVLWDGFEQQLLLTDPNGNFTPQTIPAKTKADFDTVMQKLFLADLGEDSNKDGQPDLLTDSRNVSIVDSGALELNLPIRANGYAFQKPAEWGLRSSTGELQSLISDLVQAEADLALAIDGYTGEVDAIKDAALALAAQNGIALEQVQILTKGKEDFITLAEKISKLESTAAIMNFTADTTDDLSDGLLEHIPEITIAGLAVGGDFGALAKLTVFAMERAATVTLRSFALAREVEAIELGPKLETENFEVAIADAELAAKFEIQQKLIELKTMLGGEGPARVAVFHAVEVLRQLSDAYRTKLQQGLELLEERQAFNRNAAGAVQEYRYQDMAFRVFHNEALEKYHAAFDLAARYTWLAAKAYDYETNLDAADAGSAQGILEDIIKARTVGEMVNGEPMLGDGLAGALAALRDNYEVLSGQMGLNNAQSENSKVSLRTELFRISKTTASDVDWRSKLTEFRKSDLWQVPEFRRYCRPFAAAGTAQPGLVIPLETSIVAGKNLFGKPLGAGDHAFDPSLFATKVNAVGVWFESYDLSKLSVAPRVYLVPAGLDVMTVPNSPNLVTRSWNIVDQRIPVPHVIGSSPLGIENWRPVTDTLDGPVGEIRKFSSFRAYGSAAGSTSVDTGEMNYDSRLVGRSVWNTKWLLIIPGVTFNADANTGLDTLISAEGIKDINLVIKTSGFSGN